MGDKGLEECVPAMIGVTKLSAVEFNGAVGIKASVPFIEEPVLIQIKVTKAHWGRQNGSTQWRPRRPTNQN
jgi:hypothetical protein